MFSCSEYQAKLKRFSGVLNNMVSSDMDFTQLEAYLSSQTRKKQVGTCIIESHLWPMA